MLLDEAMKTVFYKLKNWASSIMGPSMLVIYKLKNWTSSIVGPSRVIWVRRMAVANRRKLLFSTVF